MRAAGLFWCSVTVLMGAGCPDRSIAEVPLGQAKVERVEAPVTSNPNLDILFVIDNSMSMSDEQASLTKNFPRFIDVLRTIEGGMPNLRIGVITSDMGSMSGPPFGSCHDFGDNGELRHPSPTTSFLQDFRGAAPGQRDTNYAGTLMAAFDTLATVRTAGCDMEAHLMSMKRALDHNVLNRDFVRDNAYLAVIIIADEDDCSIRPGGEGFFRQQDLFQVATSFSCFRSSTTCEGPADPAVVGARRNCRPNEASPFHASIDSLVAFLKSLKSSEDQLVVAGIIGDSKPVNVYYRENPHALDLEPSCRYPVPDHPELTQIARPGVRLESFVKSFPRNLVTSICNEDLSEPMHQIARLLADSVGSPCFEGMPVEPPYCAVSEVVAAGTAAEQKTSLAACDPGHGNRPCWYLEPDPVTCATTASKLAMRVDRGAVKPAPTTRVVAECVTR